MSTLVDPEDVVILENTFSEETLRIGGRFQLPESQKVFVSFRGGPSCACPDPMSATICLVISGVTSCGDVVGCISGLDPNGTWTLTNTGEPGDWTGTLDGNFFAEVTCFSPNNMTVQISDSDLACNYFIAEGGCAPGPVNNSITGCGAGDAAYGGTATITGVTC